MQILKQKPNLKYRPGQKYKPGVWCNCTNWSRGICSSSTV